VTERTASVEAPTHHQGRRLEFHPTRRAPRPRLVRRRGRAEEVAVGSLPIEEGSPHSRILARERLQRRSLLVADLVAASLALLVTLYAAGIRPAAAVFGLLPVLVGVSKAAGLYDRDEAVLHKTTLEEAPALAQISGLFALVVWLGHGPLIGADLSPSPVLLLWTVTLGLVLLGRTAARAAARRRGTVERCLVIGSADSVASVASRLAASGAKAAVVATIELRPEVTHMDLGMFEALVEREHVDRVLVAPPDGDPTDLLELVRFAKSIGLRVSLIPRLFEVLGTAVEFDELNGLTVLGVRSARLSRSSRMLKRSFDLLGATICVILAAPAMIAIAIAIRLDSPGPILFRQVRVGRDGKLFRIFKFRSMVCDADALKPVVSHLNTVDGLFKIPGDPRLTRVGRLIRRWCLDELPQLFNVWRGDMSLVGPRPLIADEDARITGLDRSRLRLTPGMTGHWQVLGSTRVPIQEMVAIDYLYVANWSLWTDVKLLLRTIRLVVSGAGI
jgi:exopolysaccharide biosynthesis polyprenyl glycosylphosphotransferase